MITPLRIGGTSALKGIRFQNNYPAINDGAALTMKGAGHRIVLFTGSGRRRINSAAETSIKVACATFNPNMSGFLNSQRQT